MGQKREYPIQFFPSGLADAWDASQTFPGQCTVLQNIVFDQSNPEQVAARPGVGSPLTVFGSFSSPGAISIQGAIGNTVYGLIASALTAGFDQPFAYSLTGGFIAITGIAAGNVPTTQSTSGDWTPPTMAVVGAKIVFTHPGFSGANYVGFLDISNPAAPVWSAGNTATHGLPSVPVAVANFNNRAYYACGNMAYYSDVLVPGTMTNAGQALTLGDTTAITGLSGLPLASTTAGAVQSLLVFKPFQIWQITGDAAITGTLAENFLSLNVGCVSPRTIVQTPTGTIFIGIDGPYYVSPLAQVLPLTKDATKLRQDLQAPFQAIANPGRAAASYSGGIYRVCLDTSINDASSTNDYWFDITIRRWTGPHTFPFDCATQVGNHFVISHRSIPAAIFASPFIPSPHSVYNDNGVAISVVLQTAFFPKTQNINMKEVIESTIELSAQGLGTQYTITVLDEEFKTLDSVSIVATAGGSYPRWGGGSLWGDGTLWTEENNSPITNTIPWNLPLIFKKMALNIVTTASYYLSIGAFFAKYKDTGYTNK